MVGQSRFQTRKCETEDRLYETQAKKSTGEAGLLRTTHALCGRHLVFPSCFISFHNWASNVNAYFLNSEKNP